MAHDPIDVDESLVLTAEFRDTETDALVDPSTVSVTLRQPDGTLVSYGYPADVEKESVGVYQLIHDFDQAGTWRWRWTSTGAGKAVNNGEVYVRPNPLEDPPPFIEVTAAEVKAESRVEFGELDEPFDDLAIDLMVASAVASVSEIVGRTLDATLPARLAPLARQAVRMRTEQLAYQAQPDSVETSSDETLTSFSAGGYSETRRGPVRQGGTGGGVPALTGWPALDSLLWLLMTDERREYWRFEFDASAGPAPYSAVTEVDWSGTGGSLYSYGDPDRVASPFIWGA